MIDNTGNNPDNRRLRMTRKRKKTTFPAIFVVALILLPVLTVTASSIRKMNLDELTAKADVIAVGQVEKKESFWAGSRIETTVKIKAEEYWKGALGPEFEITQLGGDVLKPLPISMHADGEPRFFEGEKVVLFLEKPGFRPEKPSGKNPGSKVAASYKVLGWAYGKYSVIFDPETGKEKVVRLGLLNARIADRKVLEERMELATKLAAAGGKESAAKTSGKTPGKKSAAAVKARMKGVDVPDEPQVQKQEEIKQGDPDKAPLTMNNVLRAQKIDKASTILNLPAQDTLEDLRAKVQQKLK